MTTARRIALSLASTFVALAILVSPALARAEDAPAAAADDANAVSDDTVFTSALAALKEGRTNDAIADFEALGDRGVVDPVVSFDRGVAYAQRVRAGGEQPGDLGRAAQGFEEARELDGDEAVTRDATQALTVLRAEVARRRSQAGDPVEVDQGLTLRRAITSLASEDAWAFGALAASLLLGAALFVRWLSIARRVRIAAAIGIAAAAPILVLCTFLALFARDDRLHLHEGVLVSSTARLADAHHIVLLGASPLPEGARVTIEGGVPGWTNVRWGAAAGWLPSQTVRPIQTRD